MAVLGGGLGVGEIADAHTIKIRALARLGELLSSLEKVKGRAGPGRGKAGTLASTAFTGGSSTLARRFGYPQGSPQRPSAAVGTPLGLPASAAHCRG
jgi:hypothetical protein